MLDPNPAWTFASTKPFTKWYGNVHLLPDQVVGQWLCIDRASGQVKWQRTFFRANTIAGVESGVIVASEMRSDGPWTASFGCYGISLETGRLLWISHGSGLRGRIVRLLDFVPGFTNELRDTPHHVKDGRVFCQSGRVLDVKTGRLLQKLVQDTIQSYANPVPIDSGFYNSGLERDHPRVAVGSGLFLRHAQATEGMQRGGLEIAAEGEAGNPIWRLSIKQLDRHIDSNFYSYRLVPPFIYLVVSDEPRFRPHPTKKHYALPNPTHWHLVSIDLATGNVVQEFSLGDEKVEECRIEDVDENGLLIGKPNHELSYFRRTA